MSKIEELIKKLCPNGVEYKTIGELFDVKNVYTPSKNNKYFWENGNIPWFRMDDIRTNGNILNDATQHITELAIKNRKFPKDSLIVATTATIGVHALIKCDFVCNQQLTCVAIKEKLKNYLNIKFCFYYFDIIDEQCKKIANQGGGMPIVSLEKMKKLVFPVPPTEVQCEIVHILDDFTLLSAELKAREKQYDYYTEKIWSYLENEKRVRLDTICKIGDGLHGTPEYENNTKLWFVNGNNLENGRIIINKSTKEISNKSYNKYNGNYKIGTILMSINGTIGKIAYYTGEKIILGKSAAYFEVIEENTVCNKYLYYYLQSKKALQYFENNKTGSTIKNLGLKALREMKIPFPDRGKQEEIAGKLEKLDKLCNDISEGLPAEIEARQKQYEYYRDKLLTFKELKVNE